MTIDEYEVTGNFSGITGSFTTGTAEEAKDRSQDWVRYLKPGESITIRRLSEEELSDIERHVKEMNDANQDV